MAVPETIVDTITIESATPETSKDGTDQWAIKAVCRQISQYPQNLWKPMLAGEMIRKGDTHRVRLERGRLKEGKEGNQTHDYFWNLAPGGWDTDAPATPTAAPSSTGGGGQNQGDYRRSKEEMRLLDCLSVCGAYYAFADKDEPRLADVFEGAEMLYQMVTNWERDRLAATEPETAANAPESHVQPPAAPTAPADALQLLYQRREAYNVSAEAMAAWCRKQPEFQGRRLVELTEGEIDRIIGAIVNGDIQPDLAPAAPGLETER